MESAYVKKTVGPVLAQALTSLVMHVPFNPTPSSYATTVDPIEFLANFLLDADKTAKETAVINAQKESLAGVVAEFEKKSAAIRENRAKLDSHVRRKTAERGEDIERQMEAMLAAAQAKLVAIQEPEVVAAVEVAPETSSGVEPEVTPAN